MRLMVCFKCNNTYMPLTIVTLGMCPICEKEEMTKRQFQAQEYAAEAVQGFCPPINPYTKDNEIVSQGGTQFSTGAVRSADKAGVMYHLITPIGLRRIAETYKEGFDKYGAYNWERGMPIGDILNHAIAHIFAYLSGDVTNEDDLAHAAWNLLAAMHMEETHPHLDHQLRPNHPLHQKRDISEEDLCNALKELTENAKPSLKGSAVIDGKEILLELDQLTGKWKPA